MRHTLLVGRIFGAVARFRNRSLFVDLLFGVAVEFALWGAALIDRG